MAKRVLTVDLDGTISADPKTFQSLCAALRASGKWEVHIVTANKKGKPSAEDYEKRKQQLKELDFDAYDDLMIVDPPIAENKRKYCATVSSVMHIDNRAENIFTVFPQCAVALYASPTEKN